LLEKSKYLNYTYGMLFFNLLTLTLLVCFLVVYHYRRAGLLSGFLFDLFLGSAAASYLFLAFSSDGWGNVLLSIPLIILLALSLLVFLFGLWALIFFFFMNAAVVFKRERHSLQNSLTLIMGIALLAFALVSFVIRISTQYIPLGISIVWNSLTAVLVFYQVHALVFLTSMALCCLSRPALRQDYIIVLGAGLVDNEVTPLLAKRIQKALDFAEKQVAQTAKAPTLVLSGGRGSDERLSEAEAMANWVRLVSGTNGKNHPRLILEERSRNTLENMRFSKQLMDNESGTYHCIYSTNGYHLLRAGIYAKQAGLKMTSGIGAKTAAYYLPNAVIREYIAILSLHKKRFLIISTLILFLGILIQIFPLIMAPYY
jgi:uncharacterized SAM-binding protein YcdF (DUF218 family)